MLCDPALQAFGGAAAEESYREDHFIRVDSGPGNDALKLVHIVLDRCDLRQLFFNDLYVSHDRTVAWLLGKAALPRDHVKHQQESGKRVGVDLKFTAAHRPSTAIAFAAFA